LFVWLLVSTRWLLLCAAFCAIQSLTHMSH
jgi:hypothetical protein